MRTICTNMYVLLGSVSCQELIVNSKSFSDFAKTCFSVLPKVAFARYFSIGDKNLIEIRTKNSLVSSVFDGFLIAVPF